MEWNVITAVLFLRLITKKKNSKGVQYSIGLKDAKDLVDFFNTYTRKRKSGIIDEETYQYLMWEMGERFTNACHEAYMNSLER